MPDAVAKRDILTFIPEIDLAHSVSALRGTPAFVPHNNQMVQTDWDNLAKDIEFTLEPDLETFSRLVKSGTSVVDVGCGYGRIASQLYKLGFLVTGYDTSAEMIARGNKTYPYLNLQVTDGTIPVEDRFFGACVSIALLTSIPSECDRQKVIAEISRVVAIGGIVYVAEFLRMPGPAYTSDGTFRAECGVQMKHFFQHELLRELQPFRALRKSIRVGKSLSGKPVEVFHFFGVLE